MTENEKNLRKNIGKKIKLARTKTNYTQEALAEKTSLSPRYISQLERGIAFGSASTIVNLCNALNISSDFLFKLLYCFSFELTIIKIKRMTSTYQIRITHSLAILPST